jgi:hypothetical protein
MKQISIFTMLLMLFSCSDSKSQNEFEKFTNNFIQISFPFSLNDSIEFENWNANNLIDTSFLILYDLNVELNKNENSIKNLKDFNCTYVGKYKLDNIVILLYKTYTSVAGSGNPKIVLATFSKEGRKIDEIFALWNEAEDHLYSKRVILNILDNRNLEIKFIEKNNEFIKDELRLKKITENKLYYRIEEDGKITKGEESMKNVYENIEK